ncbi:MAG: transcriptional repressor [Roseiflexaceae bacterium]|nr:transcriptional repressor [Roseiflexaceae bacterium]
MSWTERVLASLSDRGHRVTGPRRALLERITRYAQPFTAEQLWLDVAAVPAEDSGQIGRATVYRTIELLVEQNWLARVHWSRQKETAAEGEHAYVLAEQGHQHHLVCSTCGAVITFEGCDIDALLGGLAKRLNFRIDGHWLEAHGMCQQCQRRSAG